MARSISRAETKRKWHQWSIRTLLLMTTVCAIATGIWSYWSERERVRQAAISRVVGVVNDCDGYVVEGTEFTFAKKGLRDRDLTTFLKDLQWWDDLQVLHLEESGMNDESMEELGKLTS